ncbi:response regulator transcription factor [Actinoplanes siamensis]|uniref:Uncharacterized protein n=1 Tax=Actinoplanes siamensis TaxID=1223317 RepID=A0A919NBQ8_9ACTN|nr:response regulator transcription factor [Actinoplanes siamensis]GIF07865.1 hypothetical protein Asi03nite_54030 [Actinoplanes siamensis]
MIEIELLNGRVDLVRDGVPVALTPDEGWLTVALALAPEEGLAARTIKDALHVKIISGALRQRLTRFRNRTGLAIRSADVKSAKVYHLDLTDVRVDALDYLTRVDQIRRAGPAVDDATLDAARALWKLGLPRFPNMAEPAPAAYESLRCAHEYLTGSGRRILIVDDQVGDELAARLRRHRCTVAHDLAEFEKYYPVLDDFDLAVVDLHLTQTYADNTGDTIVREINLMGVGLPVVMITLRPPENRSIPEWIRSLGLVDVIFKKRDEPGADMAFVAQRVNEILLEEPAARACDQLMHRVQKLRRKARERLRAGRSEAAYTEAVARMDEYAEKINRLASDNQLADARAEAARFVASYGE